MTQIRLKSVVAKLSMLGIYLLFLSVQINFRYTFPDSLITNNSPTAVKKAAPGSNHESLQAASEEKQDVQKLRLNKRYFPQEFFEVYLLQENATIHFAEEPDQLITTVVIGS